MNKHVLFVQICLVFAGPVAYAIELVDLQHVYIKNNNYACCMQGHWVTLNMLALKS